MREMKRDTNPRQLRSVETHLPSNPDAEAVVLGTLINYPKQLELLADSLRPADFFHHENRAIYEAMLGFYRKHGDAPDMLALTDYMRELGMVEEMDGVSRVSIRADELFFHDLQQDVRLVLGASAQRQVIQASQKLIQIGYDISNPTDLRQSVERLLYDLTMDHAPSSDFQSIEDVLEGCMKDIDIAERNRGKLLGVTTGFSDLNMLTNGLQKSDLILLAGRPGFGKTSLGMGIGYNAARAGHAVAVFSLEMGAKQLGMRLLSLVSRVPSNHMRAGWFDEGEMGKVTRARDELSDLCIHIDDTAGSPVASIRSKLRRLKAKIHRPIDLVVVDYIGLMEPDDDTPTKRENRNQEIDTISRGLKGIAREFDVPVLALAQLSRDVEKRQNKKPQLSDLRDSGGLEQNADIVMFVYREEMYDPNTARKGIADIIVAKHRNGPVGEVALAFNNALTRFDSFDEGIG